MTYISLSLITLFLTFLLGVYIFSRDRKNPVNLNFSLLIFNGVFWAFSNFMADISKNESWNLFWSRTTLIGATLIVYFFYRFSLVFPTQKTFKPFFRIVLLISTLIFIFLSPTKWNISSLYSEDGIFRIVPGILYIPFLVYFFLGIGRALFNIFYKYKYFSKLEQLQTKFVATGISIAAVLGLSTNLIFPLLGNSRYVNFGPYFILFFIVFTSYAVIKHHLFDIRVIATELFTVIICITLLVKILLSENLQEIISNAVIFIAVGIFSILLIRSVLKEVRQREQIEKMAEDVKRAYEVEKRAHEIETRARKELEKLDIAKDQFTRLTQHNIRTPLTAMLGYLDLILGGSYGRVPVRVKEYLRRFMISSKRLNSMVTEFMDVSKFQLGKDVVTLVSGVKIKPLIERYAYFFKSGKI